MFEFLVIEDDQKLASSIAEFLQELGDVTVENEGLAGLKAAQTGMYDVLILDIMLPGLDGLRILSQLRHDQIFTPVLILTAKDQLQDKVIGFEKGADDYLTKPFFREELVLRVKAILKRTKGLHEDKNIQVGQLKANLDTHEVSYDGQKIELVGKEFDLLVYLMQNKGLILTKVQIF